MLTSLLDSYLFDIFLAILNHLLQLFLQLLNMLDHLCFPIWCKIIFARLETSDFSRFFKMIFFVKTSNITLTCRLYCGLIVLPRLENWSTFLFELSVAGCMTYIGELSVHDLNQNLYISIMRISIYIYVCFELKLDIETTNLELLVVYTR